MTSPRAAACVWPSLGYRNAPHMIEWLVRAFGLTEDLVVAGADGEIAHSELGWHICRRPRDPVSTRAAARILSDKRRVNTQREPAVVG